MKKAVAMSVLLVAILAAAPRVRAELAPPPPGPSFESDAIEAGAPDDLLAWDADDEVVSWVGDPDGMAGGEAMGPGPGHGGPRMGPGGMHRGMRGGPGAMRRHHPRGHARLAQLDLSDSQRERMEGIRESRARKAIPLHADLQLARLDMARLMRADKPDPAALNAQIDRIARMRAEIAKLRMTERLEARAVLTPEQLRKLRHSMRGPQNPKAGASGKSGHDVH